MVVVTRPGRRTFTARKEEKTFEEAIRAAFSALEIELRKFRTEVVFNVEVGEKGPQATTVNPVPATPS